MFSLARLFAYKSCPVIVTIFLLIPATLSVSLLALLTQLLPDKWYYLIMHQAQDPSTLRLIPLTALVHEHNLLFGNVVVE